MSSFCRSLSLGTNSRSDSRNILLSDELLGLMPIWHAIKRSVTWQETSSRNSKNISYNFI